MALDTRLIVSISSPKRQNLSKPQQQFKAAVIDRIRAAGFRGLKADANSDTISDGIEKYRDCHGVVMMAFSQWKAKRLYREQDKTVILPSEFSHIKAIMATATKRPLLVLREKSLTERGVFRSGYLPHVIRIPDSLKIDWLESTEFELEFDKWRREVERNRHVFLGYSTQARGTAAPLYKYLTEGLKLRVFDWHDFHTGDSIWESIEEAERWTSCGIFLFMADDKVTAGGKREFAPRDNVVYEAGYFAGAKGRKASLIIREDGAKVPSDLGGILYLKLARRDDISSLEIPLRNWLERILGGEP